MKETIHWHSIKAMPDTDTTVMLYMPGSMDELVWPGWYDSFEMVWRCATSGSVMREQVTHWADLPQGPKPASTQAYDEWRANQLRHEAASAGRRPHE